MYKIFDVWDWLVNFESLCTYSRYECTAHNSQSVHHAAELAQVEGSARSVVLF
jgi:hypothetical protein